MLRPLSPVEEAFTYSNELYPLCVVIVLKMRHAPDTSKLRRALDDLQRRHVLLRACVRDDADGYHFEELHPTPHLGLRVLPRQTVDEWENVVETELNTTYDRSGPLVRFAYLTGNSEESELVFVLHHAIMDGVSARLLLHELLHLWNGLPLGPPLSPEMQTSTPDWPGSHGGLGPESKARFVIGQIVEEMRFSMRGMTSRPAPSSKNSIVHLSIPADVSRRISVRIGREGLNLNNVINAAMLLAVRRYLHDDSKRTLMRAISFADLRDHLSPVPDEAVLGCMVSMLRFAVPVTLHDDICSIARKLKIAMFNAGRSGASFHFARMSPLVTRMALRLERGRLSNTAVSFLGKLDLEARYGSSSLDDVHAFITNNRLGPELSGFGKVLFGRIELDLTYLNTAVSDDVAAELLSEIRVSLIQLAD